MKIAIISDAWEPQINGVVRTLKATIRCLVEQGHEICLITPDMFLSLPCPGYREIKLSLLPKRKIAKIMGEFRPDNIHIATEGPLGWAARAWCLRNKCKFTSSYHTRFPEYVAARTGIPAKWIWPIFYHFHKKAMRILVSTQSLARELMSKGLEQVFLWPRGVEKIFFESGNIAPLAYAHLPRPLLLYVGRVSIEKNLEAFLDCDSNGTKVIVGDGPYREYLQSRYPEAVFLGALTGEELAGAYAGADIFVFPSKTDTFGLVIIEALAAGLPVAAYPVMGPQDILESHAIKDEAQSRHGAVGAMHENLATAIQWASQCERQAAREFAKKYTWEKATQAFVASQRP